MHSLLVFFCGCFLQGVSVDHTRELFNELAVCVHMCYVPSRFLITNMFVSSLSICLSLGGGRLLRKAGLPGRFGEAGH